MFCLPRDPLATGLLATDLRDAASFVGFDFATPIWKLDPALQGSPALWLQR